MNATEGTAGYVVLDISSLLPPRSRITEQNLPAALDAHDFSKYRGADVGVKGCIAPTWAFMMVTARLLAAGARVYFGDGKEAKIPIG